MSEVMGLCAVPRAEDSTTYPLGTMWRFQMREDRDPEFERVEPLFLHWEVSGDPFSEDWDPYERDAEDLLVEWVRDLVADDRRRDEAHDSQPREWREWEIDRVRLPHVPIYWGVEPTIEAAPFQEGGSPRDGRSIAEHNFLTFYTWPEHAVTGERLQWTRLPVANKLWTPRRWQPKGGFLQQATGWKPSPLQGRVHLPLLLAASGHQWLASDLIDRLARLRGEEMPR